MKNMVFVQHIISHTYVFANGDR